MRLPVFLALMYRCQRRAHSREWTVEWCSGEWCAAEGWDATVGCADARCAVEWLEWWRPRPCFQPFRMRCSSRWRHSATEIVPLSPALLVTCILPLTSRAVTQFGPLCRVSPCPAALCAFALAGRLTCLRAFEAFFAGFRTGL